MKGLLLLALLIGGCGGDTSLLLDLGLAAGLPQPDHLQLRFFAQGQVGAPIAVPLAGRSLPGRLVVQHLDAALPDLRLLVDGRDAADVLVAQAASRVQLRAGAQTHLSLTLDRPGADSDGDGIPDTIDDCPQLADPDQRCGTAPPDLGGSGSGTDDGGTVAISCPDFAVFCDDFESGNTSKWSQVVVKSNASVTVDGVQPHTGKLSLDASAKPNNNTSTSATLAVNLLPTGGTVATRFYFRTPANPGSFALVMALFANTSGWSVGVDANGHWVVTQDQGNLPDLTSNVLVPIDQWVCVELQVDPPAPGDPKGRVRLWANGSPVLDLPPDNWTVPTVFQFGLVRAPGTQETRVFLDDVALASKRIGCP